jgi:hypothetical protein
VGAESCDFADLCIRLSLHLCIRAQLQQPAQQVVPFCGQFVDRARADFGSHTGDEGPLDFRRQLRLPYGWRPPAPYRSG